jgi:hypothetical protein
VRSREELVATRAKEIRRLEGRGQEGGEVEGDSGEKDAIGGEKDAIGGEDEDEDEPRNTVRMFTLNSSYNRVVGVNHIFTPDQLDWLRANLKHLKSKGKVLDKIYLMADYRYLLDFYVYTVRGHSLWDAFTAAMVDAQDKNVQRKDFLNQYHTFGQLSEEVAPAAAQVTAPPITQPSP